MVKDAAPVVANGPRPASPNAEGRKGDGKKGAMNGGKGSKGAKGPKGGKKGQEEEKPTSKTPAAELAIKEYNFVESKTVQGKSWASMAAKNAAAPAPAPAKPAPPAPKVEEPVEEPEATPEPEPVEEPTPAPKPVVETPPAPKVEEPVAQPAKKAAQKKEKKEKSSTPFDTQSENVVIAQPHPLHSRDAAARAATATLSGTTSPSYEAQLEKVVLPEEYGSPAADAVVFSGVPPAEPVVAAPVEPEPVDNSWATQDADIEHKPAEITRPATQQQPKQAPASPKVAAPAAAADAAAPSSPTAVDEQMFDRTGWGTAEKPGAGWGGQAPAQPAMPPAAAPQQPHMQNTWNPQGQNLQNVNRAGFGSAGSSGYQGKNEFPGQNSRQNGNYQNKKGGAMNAHKQGGRGQHGQQGQGGKGGNPQPFGYGQYGFNPWSQYWPAGRNGMPHWQGATNYGNYPSYYYSPSYMHGYGFPAGYGGEEYFGAHHGAYPGQQYGGGRDHGSKAIPNSAYSSYAHGGHSGRQNNKN